MPLKGSLRTNQWSPADASSHKFRVAHRGAAPSSQRRAARLPSLTMANQYFYVRARRPRPNSAPERCPRDNTWTRRHGGQGGAHGWRVRGRALSATTRKRRETRITPSSRRRPSNVAAHTQTPHPFLTQKPENALKRANELSAIGNEKGALQVLHDVLTAKKSRTWVKVLESIMLKYIDIAVDLKLHRHAKDGLHQYRNISQQQAPQSLEAIIQHLLKAGESRVAKAAKEARSMNLGKGKAVADLECEQTPEAIMLSTMTDEGDGDRSEREALVPWLKFLWETYRSVLDILKTNSKLEKVYHQTAQRAFEFCVAHERKTEMRRLCETLRHHLSNLQRATAQGNTNRLRGWEGWTQEGIELHLATRFAQLEAASAQELWTEGFRTVEDIHQVMRISKKPPKAKLMAKYYERLTKIFWVSGNYLFHAYAWWRHAQLAKESQKRPPPVEDQIQMACSVLLSALAIPDASDGAPDRWSACDRPQGPPASSGRTARHRPAPAAATRSPAPDTARQDPSQCRTAPIRRPACCRSHCSPESGNPRHPRQRPGRAAA